MSPEAMRAELKLRGVETYDIKDRSQLEQAVVLARRSSSHESSPQDSPNGSSWGTPTSLTRQQRSERQKRGLMNNPLPPPLQPASQPQSNNNSMNNILPPMPSKSQIPLTPSNKIPPPILHIIRTSANATMTAIDFDGRHIGDREVTKLSEALSTNSTVQILSLRNCKVSDVGCAKLADCLLRNEHLTALHLDGNEIGTEGAAALSTALITNETLQVLTLSDNANVGDRGMVYLIGALEHNTTIRTLEVETCGVHDTTRIDQIDELLQERQIDSNFESLLERLLDDDFRVTGIDLSGRQLGDKGVARLAEALADNTQVRQLWLRGCKVGNGGALALASCLEQNMSIVDLFLGNNDIGNEGVNAISDALALSNSTLVSLEMDDNKVGDSGVDSFTNALEKNTSVLVASFENNALDHPEKLERLQMKLTERRDGMNLVSFVVDPDADTQGSTDANSGVVNMSVCSSYMPSTYRRAGFGSVAGSASVLNKSMGSHNFSVYNRANMKKPPPPPPPQQPMPASPNSGSEASVDPTISGSERSPKKKLGRKRTPPPAAVAAAAHLARVSPGSQDQQHHTSDPSMRRSSSGGGSGGKRSPGRNRGQDLSSSAPQLVNRGQVVDPSGHAIEAVMERSRTSSKSGSRGGQQHLKLVPIPEKVNTKKKNISDRTLQTDNVAILAAVPEMKDPPQTDKNYDETLNRLCRRVEMMRRMNQCAAAHYRARQFWFWFTPISLCIFLAGVLSLVSAVDISGTSRVTLSLCTGAFALAAFVLNFLQTQFGWSSRSEVHRSAGVEMTQVGLRLDTLRKYEGGRLSSGSVSSRSRANAVRDLYRIDVYLQAMQKCTPEIPDQINESFHLLASRLHSICSKYPNAVRQRLGDDYDDGTVDLNNPVPYEMQLDALDLLGLEIQNYFLYPLFLPDAKKVVSRTIDIFFAKPPAEPETGRLTQSSGRYTVYEDDDYMSRGDVV